MAADRGHPEHKANGDEQRYATANYLMSFTKGLCHDDNTGVVKNPEDFEAFRSAIDNGFVEAFTSRVPVPRAHKRRKWEAPTAGLVYDLQGPDPQAVTMPPAPELCSDELTFEMAEVYELALVRDVPFKQFQTGGSNALNGTIGRLNDLDYAENGFQGRPRKNNKGKLDKQTVFRGSSPGVEKGPYLSQFMLIGNASGGSQIGPTNPEDGYITYGAQRIDQRVLHAMPGDDYMINWQDWLDVQQGYEVRQPPNDCSPMRFGPQLSGQVRFITTPRDLATYVHVDALYQAYLNACLILLGNGTPFDPAFDLLSGGGDGMLYDPMNGSRVPLNANGFALWGGPHILSLVTEVATRALKAVRYQKFNNHLRLRPEALAGRIARADVIEACFPVICGCLTDMETALKSTLHEVKAKNNAAPNGENLPLLPMAFEEGSPMHPAYGAGHATVAGACVTILKAFFDTSAVFAKIDGVAGFYGKARIAKAVDCGESVIVGSYTPTEDGQDLHFHECGTFDLPKGTKKKGKGKTKDKKGSREYEDLGPPIVFVPKDKKNPCCPLTLEGELNKLAANISIGRNMAGVHFYSDYHDSLRMGEQIAIGILEEQGLCYPTDPFVVSLPTYDGDVVRIGQR